MNLILPDFYREIVQSFPDKKITFWFQDETRVGAKTRLTGVWAQKGMRPTCKKGIGFQNSYLYGSVEPETGKHIGLICDGCSVYAMNIHLNHVSQSIESDEHAILITDGAAWHRSTKLQIPENISIIHLPPYTPEFNPIERLWLWLKEKYLSNIVLNTKEEIFSAIERAWKKITESIVQQICNADAVLKFAA